MRATTPHGRVTSFVRLRLGKLNAGSVRISKAKWLQNIIESSMRQVSLAGGPID
jgi:hypothetical protein